MLFGTIPVFTTPLAATGVNAVVQVIWRLMVGAPILVLLTLLVQRRDLKGLRLRDALGFVGVGALLLGLFLTYVGSLSLGTPAATAVLLLYSQPVFTVLLSRLLHERITRTRLAALVLGVSGVLVVFNPLGAGRGPGVGQVLALSSGIFYALYIVASRRIVSGQRFHPLTTTSLSFVGALVSLVPVSLLLQASYPRLDLLAGMVTSNAHQVELSLGLIVLGTILPYVALNLGLTKMEASDAGMTLLVEPISASAFGYLLLGQSLGQAQVVGGFLIITSIVLVNLRIGSARSDAKTAIRPRRQNLTQERA